MVWGWPYVLYVCKYSMLFWFELLGVTLFAHLIVMADVIYSVILARDFVSYIYGSPYVPIFSTALLITCNKCTVKDMYYYALWRNILHVLITVKSKAPDCRGYTLLTLNLCLGLFQC